LLCEGVYAGARSGFFEVFRLNEVEVVEETNPYNAEQNVSEPRQIVDKSHIHSVTSPVNKKTAEG
jgi:hypothetical protein